MKRRIAILGSTGSIGKTLLRLLKNNTKDFQIVLLTANKSHLELLSQAKKFNVKNLIITDENSYKFLKQKTKNSNINVYNNFNHCKKFIKKKLDYTMSSISGIIGLEPTLKIIKYSKKIAIANKESIICGWNLIKNELKKNNTDFIPVDSEHFSIWYGLQSLKPVNLEKIFITASGGPFYKKTPRNFSKVKISDALKHPNWKMGKKISIDSATLINKIYEVVEAKNIFDINYKKIEILMHPKSYVHAILKFNNGLTKLIVHDTTMEIPIFNTLFINDNKKLISKKINLESLNNLRFKKVNSKIFPMIKLLNYLPSKQSLYETVIVSANDTLVNLFLLKKIKFTDINKYLFILIKQKEFQQFKKKQPKSLEDILYLNNYVRLKVLNNVYKS